MTKGEAAQIKVHFKGRDEDFVVFIDDVGTYNKWKGDKSIPLAHFVASFKVFVTHKHGAQGTFDEAAKGTLEGEFNTSNSDEAIKQVLEKGTLQESEFPERQGNKNDSQGRMVGH